MKTATNHLASEAKAVDDLVADHLGRFGLDCAEYLTRERPRFARRLVLLAYRSAIMDGLPPSRMFKLARHFVGKHLAAVAGRGSDINFGQLNRNERQILKWRWAAEENGAHMEAWFRHRLDELTDLSEREKEVAEVAGELQRTWGIESARKFIIDYGIDFTRGFLLMLARHHARGKAGRTHARWAVGVLNRIPEDIVPGVLYWARPWWAADEAEEADELRDEIEYLNECLDNGHEPDDEYDYEDYECVDEDEKEDRRPLDWHSAYRQALRNPPPKPAPASYDEDDYEYDEEDDEDEDDERESDDYAWLVPRGYWDMVKALAAKLPRDPDEPE